MEMDLLLFWMALMPLILTSQVNPWMAPDPVVGNQPFHDQERSPAAPAVQPRREWKA